jgi:hypothetical protein
MKLLSALQLFILDQLYLDKDGLSLKEIEKRVKSSPQFANQPCNYEVSEMQGDGDEGSGFVQKLYDVASGEPIEPQSFVLDERCRSTYKQLCLRYNNRPMPTKQPKGELAKA